LLIAHPYSNPFFYSLGQIVLMARIVMKFGGTSVATVERIRNVAKKVKAEVDNGHEVAVVLSAMSGETDRLVGFVREAAELYDTREYDAVVATGEQVTIGLLAIVLQSMGVPARSWMGWQLPVKTDGAHGSARIQEIDTTNMISRMIEGQVAVMAGFQGIGPDGRVTTLGRGGSDTSAVALAAALKADRCDIYTDVDGIYTTDPRIVPQARKLAKITYEEMLELASVGAKVLQTRSVELAMKERVRVQVLSSFEEGTGESLPGTLVVDEEEIVEKELIAGVAYSKNEAKISIMNVPDTPGVSAAIFAPLAAANVNVDMIIQNIAHDGSTTDLTFTIPATDISRALDALDKAKANIGHTQVLCDKNVAKISVVGVGMKSHAGVALTMFKALADKGINIQVISTSEIKISVLIAAEYVELAVRALHTAYGLDADAA
jgi:aspartate kinase